MASVRKARDQVGQRTRSTSDAAFERTPPPEPEAKLEPQVAFRRRSCSPPSSQSVSPSRSRSRFRSVSPEQLGAHDQAKRVDAVEQRRAPLECSSAGPPASAQVRASRSAAAATKVRSEVRLGGELIDVVRNGNFQQACRWCTSAHADVHTLPFRMGVIDVDFASGLRCYCQAPANSPAKAKHASPRTRQRQREAAAQCVQRLQDAKSAKRESEPHEHYMQRWRQQLRSSYNQPAAAPSSSPRARSASPCSGSSTRGVRRQFVQSPPALSAAFGAPAVLTAEASPVVAKEVNRGVQSNRVGTEMTIQPRGLAVVEPVMIRDAPVIPSPPAPDVVRRLWSPDVSSTAPQASAPSSPQSTTAQTAAAHAHPSWKQQQELKQSLPIEPPMHAHLQQQMQRLHHMQEQLYLRAEQLQQSSPASPTSGRSICSVAGGPASIATMPGRLWLRCAFEDAKRSARTMGRADSVATPASKSGPSPVSQRQKQNPFGSSQRSASAAAATSRRGFEVWGAATEPPRERVAARERIGTSPLVPRQLNWQAHETAKGPTNARVMHTSVNSTKRRTASCSNLAR